MATTRVLHGVVPVEIVAIVAAAVLAPRMPIPIVIPLLAAASASLWLRGRSFAAMTGGPAAAGLLGAGAGAIALVLAVVLGTPVVEGLSGEAVQWSMYPIVRGSPNAFFMIAMLTAVGAVAAELVLRGWILERALELGRGHAVLAIVTAAIAEAAVIGNVGAEVGGGAAGRAMRLGAGVSGLALGWMYLGAGRRIVAPICARLTFALGALVLEALRVIG